MGKTKTKFGFLAAFLVAVGLVILSPDSAFAAVKTWDGSAGDHQFNTAANWTPSGAPVNGDELVFPLSGVTDFAPNNDMVGLSVAGIDFTGVSSGSSSYTVTGNSLTITGTIDSDVTGSFVAIVGTPIVVSGGQQINASADDSVFLTGAVSGSGNLTKTGAGSFGLSANNSSYTGAIAVNVGALIIEHANSLGGTGAGTTVASGAALVACFSADTTVAEPLTVNGNGNGTFGALHVGSCGGLGDQSDTLTLSGAITLGSNTSVSGANADILKVTGNLSGSFTLTMLPGFDAFLNIASGSNTSLTANGVYVSDLKTTTINAGDDQPSVDITITKNNLYIINGVRGDITVQSGGVLKGSGTVASISSDLGSEVAPGNSPGCLTSGAAILAGTFTVEIGGTTVCSGYDQLIVNGTVDITGNLSTSLFNGFKPGQGQVYTIINNDGGDAVTGTFSGLSEGATFSVSGYVFRISYVGGSGNDVTLTVVSVPSVPNAGVKFVTGNPIIVAAIGVAASAVVFFVGRKFLSR